MQVADVFCLFHSRLGIEECLVVHTVVHVGVDGEVADAERGEVLEEVRPLAGVNAVVGQSGFHDDACGRYVRPLHGDAQPGVAASPASRSYQDVVASLLEEALVYSFNLPGYFGVVRGAVSLRLDVDHVVQVVHDAVPQRVVAPQQQVLVGDGGKVFVQHLLAVYDGAYLQEVERPGLVFFPAQVGGKLYLHGAAHFLLSVLQGDLQQPGQGEYIVLQDVGKGDDLSSARVEAVPDDLVIGVVGRGYVVQGSVFFSLLDMQFQQVEPVVLREVFGRMQVEGVEACLRLAQGNLQFAGLEHLGWVIGGEPEGQASVYNVFPQSECQVDDAFFGLLVAQGVIIQRACYAGHAGVVAVAVLVAHHLLQDDRHLLLVDDVACGLHVCFRVAEEYRGIYAFDGIAKHAQHFILVIHVWNHIRAVDSGKGLVM